VREQFHNLQALRGAACLAVVVFHAATLEARYGLSFSPLKPALWLGYAGVDLFFVLSGFIIATVSRPDLGRPARLPKYLFRRAWRIYPTFWAVLALSVAVMSPFADGPIVPPVGTAAWFDALLLLPGDGVLRAVGVAWTLWFELMFYAAFAALFLLPRRAAVPALLGWAAVVIAAHPSTRPENRFIWLATSPFVLEFLAGALVAWCPARLTGRQAATLTAAAAAWCGVASAVLFHPDPAWLPLSELRRATVFGPAAALLVFALTGWERTGGRLRWRWLEAVGDASYSVYLLHFQLMLLVGFLSIHVGWPHSRGPHVVWLVAVLAAGVLPAMGFYRAVERPLLSLVKRKRREATPAAPVDAPPVRRAA
jgi:peptidoglycan/LPS O-acetylase OafA/YrhL